MSVQHRVARALGKGRWTPGSPYGECGGSGQRHTPRYAGHSEAPQAAEHSSSLGVPDGGLKPLVGQASQVAGRSILVVLP